MKNNFRSKSAPSLSRRYGTAIIALALLGASASGYAASAEDFAGRYRESLLADKSLPCRSNEVCAAAGVAALAAGHIEEARKIVDTELALAVADSIIAGSDNAANSASARVAMAQIHHGDVDAKSGNDAAARAWYHFAINQQALALKSPVLSRVIAVAHERLTALSGRNIVARIPATGATFESYVSLGSNNEISLTPMPGKPDTYTLSGSFIYPVVMQNGDLSANVGDLVATVRFFAGEARVAINPDQDGPIDATHRIVTLDKYTGADRCLIEFQLSAPETLKVRTLGSPGACGFGHNVEPDGTYYLTRTSVR
ncbi:hypothetical protein [Paraburkholderia flava]|uniref:hypothetical protein n=1 Tax=Paraburkholderia flava TaxID=2547393 RepID=UPI00105E306E|nr:hypothetical protein [Paraburkholderia flava]